jgi:hypothetical protein
MIFVLDRNGVIRLQGSPMLSQVPLFEYTAEKLMAKLETSARP